MHGFPKHLNSKFDFEYVRENFSREKWAPLFEELLSEQKVWVCTGTLVETETGIEDATHKIVESEAMDKTIVRYQYDYVADENCRMIRLGYTVEEINDILA